MSERPPQSGATPGRQEDRPKLPERTIDNLAALLGMRREAQRRDIEDAYGNFIRAVRSDAFRLNTGNPAEFERQADSILRMIEEAARSPILAEEIRTYLQNIPTIVRNFMEGRGDMAQMEGLKASHAKAQWYLRQTIDTLETLSKKADEYRIEKGLAEAENEEEETSAKLEEITQEQREISIYDPESEEYDRLSSEIETLNDELRRIKELKTQLEEQKLLRDEPMLIETGLSLYDSAYTAEDGAVLSNRLQVLRTGASEAVPERTRMLEKSLAHRLREAHRVLMDKFRALESEFLKQEWQRPRYARSDNFAGRLANFLETVALLFKEDIWPSDRIGSKDAEERQSFESLPRDARARLLLEKIRKSSMPRESPEREKGRFYPSFAALSHRRWLPLPINPNNAVFLSKCREALVEDLIRKTTREFIVSAETEGRTYQYQEAMRALGPHLEGFVSALNSVRAEGNKEPLSANRLNEAERAEIITAMVRANLDFAQVFRILRSAKNILLESPARKKAEAEVAKAYPRFEIRSEDRTRWQESILRDILREADKVSFEIRSGGRKIWARRSLIEILRNPQTAVEQFRNKLPPERDPGRQAWLDALIGSASITAEEILAFLAGNAPARQEKINELDSEARRISYERYGQQRKLEEIKSIARTHQAKASSMGGRNILREREERDRAGAEQRRTEKEDRGETGKRGERPRDKEEFQFAKEKTKKERAESAAKIWQEPTEKARPLLEHEAQRTLLKNVRDSIVELKKIRQARVGLSSEDEGKIDTLLRQLDALNRVQEKSSFERGLRSLMRAAETVLGVVPASEIEKRVRAIFQAYEKERRRGRIEGEAAEAAPAAEGKGKKKGKRVKSKKEERKAALDERYKGREKSGGEKTADSVRKEKQARKKK